MTGEAARERVLELTDGVGVDVAIEAVGIPETFELCTDIVRSGGHVANVGVHGKPATLHLERLWIKGVTITTGLVDTLSTPRLMNLVGAGKLDPLVFVTHRFALEQAEEAYDAFAAAGETGAFKVVLEGAKHQQLVPVGAAAGMRSRRVMTVLAEHAGSAAERRRGRLPSTSNCPSSCAATWHDRFRPADRCRQRCGCSRPGRCGSGPEDA